MLGRTCAQPGASPWTSGKAPALCADLFLAGFTGPILLWVHEPRNLLDGLSVEGADALPPYHKATLQAGTCLPPGSELGLRRLLYTPAGVQVLQHRQTQLFTIAPHVATVLEEWLRPLKLQNKTVQWWVHLLSALPCTLS